MSFRDVLKDCLEDNKLISLINLKSMKKKYIYVGGEAEIRILLCINITQGHWNVVFTM